MAEVSKLSITISLITFEKIAKLQDQEGYLKWRHIIRNHLRIFGLLTYIVKKHEQPVESDTGLDE